MTTYPGWATDEHAAMWLGGLWDGEGTVALYTPQSRTQPNRTVVVSNTDPDIMDRAESAVVMLGMKYKRYVSRPARLGSVMDKPTVQLKAVETIQIQGRPSFEIFRAMVPLCPRKSEALDRILASYSTDKRYRDRGAPVCDKGHPITEERSTGTARRCRLCINEYQRERYWAKKASR